MCEYKSLPYLWLATKTMRKHYQRRDDHVYLSFIKSQVLCLYLNYLNIMRAASYLKNFLERNSFYAQTKMRKHVVCCAMTHKHWGKIATFNLVFVMIRWMNVNIHLLSLAHPIKALVKQKYISLFFHNFLQKLFEVPSEPKTDQVCTFLFSTWKLTLNASVRKHHLKQFARTFTWFIGVMRHNCFQCPWNFCLQHLITSDTCSEGLPGVKLSVFATFRWSAFWNYFGIITCSCWSLRRNAKTNLGCLVMTFSGMSLFDVFFSFQVTCERELSHARNVNILHAHHASCLVPCACHPWLLVATLYTQISEATTCWKRTCPLFQILHSWNNTQTINTHANEEELEAHGFLQKEWIVQNISLALIIQIFNQSEQLI